MSNLKYFLLLVLISFSLHDKNCLISYDRCLDGKDETPITTGSIENCQYYNTYDNGATCYECKSGYVTSSDQKKCIAFPNCEGLSDDNTKCSYCKEGYAVSNDGKSCKKFDNCMLLDVGDNKCKYCNYLYHLEENGECKRTLCINYVKDVCQQCAEGYYLKDNQCEKITIPFCLYLDTSNTSKCSTCVSIIDPDENGKCNYPSKIIPGCTKYNNNGECLRCKSDYEYSTDQKTCTFKSCTKKRNVCELCKVGYNEDNDGVCVGYDGSKDAPTSSSKNNKAEFAWIIFILALLI